MPKTPTQQVPPTNGAQSDGDALPPPAPGTAEKPTELLPPPAPGTAEKPKDAPRPSPTADTRISDRPLAPPTPGTAEKPASAATLPPPQPGTAEGLTACAHCSRPIRRDQMVCTNCGGRNSLTWSRPGGARAPLALAAVTLVALGAIAGLIAWAVSDDEETTKAEAEQAEAQAPPPAPAPAPATPVEPPPTVPPEDEATPPDSLPEPTTPPEDTAPDTVPDDGSGASEPASWPAGESAHTVILLSTDQRVGADRKAREVADAGFPAGVLRSNRYPSLNPGYWVVFVGQYDSASEASEKAEDLADQGYPGGYPRFVRSR